MDAIIHRWYPASRPDDFDGVDILRMFRMFDALNIIGIEDMRLAQINGTISSSDITTEQWEKIRHHDDLIAIPGRLID